MYDHPLSLTVSLHLSSVVVFSPPSSPTVSSPHRVLPTISPFYGHTARPLQTSPQHRPLLRQDDIGRPGPRLLFLRRLPSPQRPRAGHRASIPDQNRSPEHWIQGTNHFTIYGNGLLLLLLRAVATCHIRKSPSSNAPPCYSSRFSLSFLGSRVPVFLYCAPPCSNTNVLVTV